MRINTNVAGLAAQEANANTNKTLATSLEKLSTGLKINKAADDASGLAIADKLRTQATSINQGIENANSASALIQIADRAMSEQSNILDTIKAKLIQAATDTTTDEGKESIRKDIVKLLDQFDKIAAETNYNGKTLLQVDDTVGSAVQSTLTFQLGEKQGYDVELSATEASNTAHLGGGTDTVNSIAAGETANLTDGTIGANANDLTLIMGAAGQTMEIDGIVGKITSGVNTVSLTIVTEDAAMIALMDQISASSGGSITGSNGSYTMAGTASIDFGDLYVHDLKFGVSTAAATGHLVFEGNESNTDRTIALDINVKNNDQTNAITVKVNNTDDLVFGGQLLETLKNTAADGLTTAKANQFMATIDSSIEDLNTIRADFGSSQNQIESSIRNMQTTYTNLKAAESVIRDVDYAQESATFNKQNIVAQAGTYAMSQANAVQQNVLRLLQ